ncbi:MAG: hypothetical protein FWC44_04960, partial [Methanomassiliicoccaceae archaeon]|nr:hypothetical protein [Methanomassiliicoccaceae archaeon]
MKIRTDRSGAVSTILLVVIFVAAAAVAGVVTYTFMSGDNNKNKAPEQEMAPGTMFEYEMSGVATIQAIKMEYVGQNADDFLIKNTLTTTNSTTVLYSEYPKDSSGEGSKVGGTEKVTTKYYGEKKLLVITQDDENSSVKAYTDPSNGVP